MGTLSKNIDQFGNVINKRVGNLRTNVTHHFDDIAGKVEGIDRTSVTRVVERVTQALPPSGWMALAGVALAGSLGLNVLGRHRSATAAGQLTTTLLLIGIYSKLVDRFNR
jgi:hypothetical protein